MTICSQTVTEASVPCASLSMMKCAGCTALRMSKGTAVRYLWIYRSCEQLYNEYALCGWPALLTSSLYSQTGGLSVAELKIMLR